MTDIILCVIALVILLSMIVYSAFCIKREPTKDMIIENGLFIITFTFGFVAIICNFPIGAISG